MFFRGINMRRSFVLLSVFVLVSISGLAMTVFAANSVSSVNVANQKVQLTASAGVEQIRYFTLDSPKRLVVDLYGVQPGNHGRNFSLKNGFRSLRVGPYEDKTRFVFDVSGVAFPTFSVDTENDQVVVTWQDTVAVQQQTAREVPTVGSAQITAIDFSSRSGKSRFDIRLKGSAELSGPEKEGTKIQFSLNNTTIPRSLRRSFDTLAFPSAIHSVNPYLVNIGGVPQVRFAVNLKGHAKYQIQKTGSGYAFIVDDGNYAKSQPAISGILPVTVTNGTVNSEGEILSGMPSVSTPTLAGTGAALVPTVSANSKYTGDKTSLVFDNAEVRDILRLIAEMSDLNIIASDEVKGNVTLRLIDVPWDQALELVLDITGLGMLQEGNVVRVLPKDKIRSMRDAELMTARSQEKLEPLVTEVITVSYADLGNVAVPTKKVLSGRGTITEDSRNKLLIITDVPSRIEKARELIKILDTPERQVMIEARIVEVNSNYSRDLGVNWGINFQNPGHKLGSAAIGLGGDFLVGLPAGAGSAAVEAGLGSGLTFGRIGIDQTILDLRISALESAGRGKIISTPRITTLNGETATISQGTSIPYQTSGADGPKTEFVNAELKLKVTPVINPDDSIILEILATNDSPSLTAGASAPSIDTKKAQTKVLVRDGDTTVLGGIFIENNSDADSGTPWLKDIPFLGHIFKSNKKTNTRSELLIFITPRIVRQD